MNIKRAVFMAVLVVAVAALAMPLVGLRAAASGSGASTRGAAAAKASAAKVAPVAEAEQQEQQREGDQARADSGGAEKMSADTLRALGITRVKNPQEASARLGQRLLKKGSGSGGVSVQSGQPSVEMNAQSALSTALITAIGGRDNQFSEVAIVADWDGREDCVAEREQKIDDFSFAESEIDVELTRTAISEHTVANGFNENVYYYGDSVGNLWVGTDTNPGVNFGVLGSVDSLRQINIPTLLSTGTSGGVAYNGTLFCIDDQVVVTGIAVNPVADLCDFGLGGVIGEVVYVSIVDTEGCVITSFGSPLPIRTRILEFAFVDGAGAGAMTPANLAGGAFGARTIVFAVPVDFAGVAVDDDGSIYFQLADAIQLSNGGTILKMAETRHTGACCATPGITRVIPRVGAGFVLTSVNVWQGTTAFPIANTGGVRGTNYSGVSTLFGNIIAINTGPCNVLYAAVSGGAPVGTASGVEQGLFSAPSAFPAGTPSMVISFADCSGLVDSCSGQATFPVGPDPDLGGILPVGDGFADRANASVTTLIPGVNNYRIFVLGNGPDISPAVGGTAIVPGTPAGLLRIPELQIDYVPAHAGIAVSQEGAVFVISGGGPAGVGRSPSPTIGEILCFEDGCPADRRADPVDLRTTGVFPNPGLGAGNTGDGVSNRFDHIFYQSPLDVNTATPAGLAGLNFGFLRYTNRLAPNAMSPGVTLGQVGSPLNTVLPDNGSAGPIIWEGLDPGHQVAGGDDQIGPFRGDDNDGFANPPIATNPPLGGLFVGGFEFTFAADVFGPVTATIAASPAPTATTFSVTSATAAAQFPLVGYITIRNPVTGAQEIAWFARSGVNFTLLARGLFNTPTLTLAAGFTITYGTPATPGCTPGVWNAFFWNSNGNITFGIGDSSQTVNVPLFRQGPPRIAPAWAKLNPASRLQGFCDTFPVLAIGYANVNAFTLRWINVPENGKEACVGLGHGRTNTFRVTLYDDGTGFDENNALPFDPLNPQGTNTIPFDQFEGPTDLRFTREPLTQTLVGCSPRPEASGIFAFEYCRMDLLGTADRPVIVGYSIGGQSGLNPPGLCETNLSEAARAADGSPFGTLAGGVGGCDGDTNLDAVLVSSCVPCCIGEGTEPEIFELFNGGLDAEIGAGGEVFFARACFDLRFEGNDAALCTNQQRQRNLNRGHVCFVGVSCQPTNPTCQTVVIGPFVPTPTTTGVINAICQVQLNLVGCGFFPNETTQICTAFADETGLPITRPGKTVNTTAQLFCDTNGDGVLDSLVALNTTPTTNGPINCNLVRATVNPLANLPGTGFPVACCGGAGSVVVTTSFTPGDNNIFGTFTRTTTCTFALGTRAPVVFSVSPSSGPCGICQDTIITGACFTGITGVFAVDRANPATVIQATNFQVLNAQAIDALFCFGSANAGKTFLIFVTGPGGTSRNLSAPVAGQPGAPCPTTGNEQGIQVTFTCTTGGVPCPPGVALPGCPCPTGVPDGTNGCVGTPVDIAVVNGCKLDRTPAGAFILDVFGRNLKPGADVKLGSTTPRRIKFREADTSFPGGFVRITLKGGVCGGLPGIIVVTNPSPAPGVPVAPSQPFACSERCPEN